MTSILDEVVEGLASPRKALPCKLLYDEAGSDLFERITRLPEYYLGRTETAILRQRAADIAGRAGPAAVLIEYGAGASVKTRILLDAMEQPRAYIPIDVSVDALDKAKPLLQNDYPDLEIRPVVANFLQPPALPDMPGGQRRVGFFPGSTIGNLSDEEIGTFLTQAAGQLGPDALLVLGADLRKDPGILIPAYDDEAGVTAAFNLNILNRINRDLAADFDTGSFRHEARWNDRLSRVEMHLVSTIDQDVHIGGHAFHFGAGESIHTENSRKFDLERLRQLLAGSGWSAADTHTDDADMFAVIVLVRP